VPEDFIKKSRNKKIYIDSITSFVDSASGKELRNTEKNEQVNKDIKRLLRDYQFEEYESKINESLVETMIWDFLTNRFDKFVERYDKLEPKYIRSSYPQSNGPSNHQIPCEKKYTDSDAARATDFYLSLGNVALGSVTQYASFTLPVRSKCIPPQTVVLTDNGDKTMALIHGTCDNPIISIKEAYLKVTSHKSKRGLINLKKNVSKPVSNNITSDIAEDIFPAEDLSFGNKWCEQVTLIFPSLASMKYATDQIIDIKLHLDLNHDKHDYMDCKTGHDNNFKTRYVMRNEVKVKLAASDLTATAVTSSQVNLKWTDSSTDETGFKVERKTGNKGTYAQVATVGSNVISYSDTDLKADEFYYYRVRAYNAGTHSAYSNEVIAKTPAKDAKQ
jgi:hypothetical protein